MMEFVSIGIPTYNRPDGLKRTLERVVNQSYGNLEIIVSDNCSPGPDTEAVVRGFMKKDSRIKYYKQEINKGLIYNFQFVLSQATSDYFMWATDDDYFESIDLVERLMEYAGANILTFTNYNFISDEGIESRYFTPVYSLCETRADYIRAFCYSGFGHPSTGIYNLKLIREAGIELRIQDDLNYHMEGILLHRIFDTGKVKYVDNALINYSTFSRASSSVIPAKRVIDFLRYTRRVLIFYLFRSRNSLKEKLRLLRITVVLHYNYFINQLNGVKFRIHRFSVAVFLIKVITARR